MKKLFQINFFLVGFLLITILNSCNDASLGPGTNSLEENYLRWKKFGIDSYIITQQRMCFCVDGGLKATVVVRGNVIVDVIDSTTSKPIPKEKWQWYKTIDQLFEKAIGLQNSKPARFDLKFDQDYGFPQYFWVDPNAQIADEEYGYISTSFRKYLR